MKSIVLADGKHAKVDDGDHAWLMAFGSWSFYKKGGYAYSRVHQGGQGAGAYKHVPMHRLVAIKHSIVPDDPKVLVDHRDRDKLNNQTANLRPANRSQNGANRTKPKSKSMSAYKGVSLDKGKGKYRAVIMVNYKRIHLGWFGNARDAAKAYNEAALKHFGDFAVLNDVNNAQ